VIAKGEVSQGLTALQSLFPEGWTVSEHPQGGYILSAGPLPETALRLLAALFALSEDTDL